jgi:hypothetical protein
VENHVDADKFLDELLDIVSRTPRTIPITVEDMRRDPVWGKVVRFIGPHRDFAAGVAVRDSHVYLEWGVADQFYPSTTYDKGSVKDHSTMQRLLVGTSAEHGLNYYLERLG